LYGEDWEEVMDSGWLKTCLGIMCGIYWAGIISGWYSGHPIDKAWYNPDAFIHSGLAAVSVIWIGDKLNARWKKKLARVACMERMEQ
jgi:hypothetical protein